MKVERWIDYDKSEKFETSVGGFGGFFSDGMRWKDYLEQIDSDKHHYLEAIRESVLLQNLRLTGEQHQYGPAGVPMFEDGTLGKFSYRGWGDLMAAIWAEAEDKDYHYMQFYM